ncbi:hypothetical protein SAURM35S_01968 [Streptomyces aurantiogriseus]
MCGVTYAHCLRALAPHRRKRRPADLPATT